MSVVWINDRKLQDLIKTWRGTPGYGYIRDAADDLDKLIKESSAAQPAPSEGSKQCMIYSERDQK